MHALGLFLFWQMFNKAMEGFYYFDGQTSRHLRGSVCELHFKSSFLPDDMLTVFHGRVQVYSCPLLLSLLELSVVSILRLQTYRFEVWRRSSIRRPIDLRSVSSAYRSIVLRSEVCVIRQQTYRFGVCGLYLPPTDLSGVWGLCHPSADLSLWGLWSISSAYRPIWGLGSVSSVNRPIALGSVGYVPRQQTYRFEVCKLRLQTYRFEVCPPPTDLLF